MVELPGIGQQRPVPFPADPGDDLRHSGADVGGVVSSLQERLDADLSRVHDPDHGFTSERRAREPTSF